MSKRQHRIEKIVQWEKQVLFEGAELEAELEVEEAAPVEEAVFEGESEPLAHGGCRNRAGRSKLRLSDKPGKRTAHSILQPKIDELLEFATDQGVTYEEVIELLEEKRRKKKKGPVYVAEVPINEAVAFYFNQEHSTRSWTELRLFLGQYGLKLPTRNDINRKKKKCFLKV